MKYTKKGGGNSYNRNTIKRKRNKYTFLPNIHESVTIQMFSEFDTLACTTIEDNQQWWIDLIKPYRDAFLKKSKETKETKETYSGIYLHCLDKCVMHAEEKVEIIQGKPGLNILMSCNTDLTARKLNARDNTKGIYYLGFQSNIHYLQNILLMPRRHPKHSEFNEIRIQENIQSNILTKTINVSMEKILRYMLQEKGIDGKNKDLSCVYFTRQNILKKIEAILENIDRIEKKEVDRISQRNGIFHYEDGTPYESYEKFQEDVKGQYNPFSNAYLRNVEQSKQNLQTYRNRKKKAQAEQEERKKQLQEKRLARMKRFIDTYRKEIETFFTDVGYPQYIPILDQLPTYPGLDSILEDVQNDFEAKEPQERIGELLYAIHSIEGDEDTSWKDMDSDS